MLFGIMETRRDRKMLDKTLPYAEIWMTRPLQQNVPITPLAEGFEFRFYQKKMNLLGRRLRLPLGNFKRQMKHLSIFNKTLLLILKNLKEGCFCRDKKRRKSSNLYRLAKKIKRASVSGFSLVSSETRLPRKRARKSIDCQSLARISYPPYGRTNLSSHTDMEPSGDCSL